MCTINIKIKKNFIIIFAFFRSSTPILNNRVNEEPTKAPTIDLFDMLNASDYREEPYILTNTFYINVFYYINHGFLLSNFYLGVTIKKTNNFIPIQMMCHQNLLQDIG